MRELGFVADADGVGNAVGSIGDGPRELLLLGHIDTVPGQVPIRREGDLFYGRGSVDAKGPLAAFIAAVGRLGALPGWRITVVGAVEEEAATSRGARYLLDRHQPEFVIIGEPSGWESVTLGYKGRLLIDYELTRGLTHTAGQDVSAAEQAFAFWQSLSVWCEERNVGLDKAFDRILPSIRTITAAPQGLYDATHMTLSLRLPPVFDREDFEVAARGWAGDAQLSYRGYEAAYRASARTPLASAFRAAIRQQGGRAGTLVKTGTSDMNVVGPVWQCPILAYGPGDSSLDHTPDEHIDLREYLRAIAVLQDAITRLCS